MTIDLVTNFFHFGTPQGKRLISLFRQEIFEEVSKSDQYGLIFTYMWAFDVQAEWHYPNDLCNLFESRGSEICLIELEANFDVRIAIIKLRIDWQIRLQNETCNNLKPYSEH
jgi:hypothetical protein